MKSVKSRIDELVKRKETLLILRQMKIDNTHNINSKIETKIKKLENIAYQNSLECDADVAIIEREIRKTNSLIDLEKEYVNSLSNVDNNSLLELTYKSAFSKNESKKK